MPRTYLRIVVVVLISLGVSLLLIKVVLAPKYISDDDLRSLYETHKVEFETLKQMSLEDTARSHRQRFAVVPFDKTSAELNGIEAVRFEQYVALLGKLGVISIHGDKDYVHFVVCAPSWAGSRGKRQGLAWRDKPPPENGKLGKSRFVHIENGWYIFDFRQ